MVFRVCLVCANSGGSSRSARFGFPERAEWPRRATRAIKNRRIARTHTQKCDSVAEANCKQATGKQDSLLFAVAARTRSGGASNDSAEWTLSLRPCLRATNLQLALMRAPNLNSSFSAHFLTSSSTSVEHNSIDGWKTAEGER